MIGAMRGIAMIKDEDSPSESESEVEVESEGEEIQGITDLEYFASMLQKAHGIALAKRESAWKWPKMSQNVCNNSDHTQQQH